MPRLFHPALSLVGDIADLVLGRACLGCDAPGPSLCSACLDTLRRSRIVLPGSGRMPPTFAGTGYEGLAQRTVIAYKEHADRSLARPLGLMLADSISAIHRQQGHGAVTLVPVPGHRHRARGFDALGAIVRAASDALADRGIAAEPRRLLCTEHDYAPLKGLGRDERFAHIAGAFGVVPSERIPDEVRARPLIVVDDVVTTGATVTEAVRALLRSGLQVAAIAAVAATPAGRRHAA